MSQLPEHPDAALSVFSVILIAAGLFIVSISALSLILPFPASAIGAWVLTVTGTGLATM
jgi:hypothetical protein